MRAFCSCGEVVVLLLVLILFLALAWILIYFFRGCVAVGIVFRVENLVALLLWIVLFLHGVLRIVSWFGEVRIAVFLDRTLVTMIDLLIKVSCIVGLAAPVLRNGSDGAVWIVLPGPLLVLGLIAHSLKDVKWREGVAWCALLAHRFWHFRDRNSSPEEGFEGCS